MTVNNRGSPGKKISNENHLADINDTLQHTQWFLTLLGIWPYVMSKSTKIQRLVPKFELPFPPTSIIILVIPIINHMILRDMARPQILILLGLISFRIANILKNLILIMCRDSIKFCIRHMDTGWRRIENPYDRDINDESEGLREYQILAKICHEFGKAAYMIDWYRLTSKASLSLIMVIAMSNYPRKLTAGRMMELSTYSFDSIMKTLIAYLNMLEAVAE